MKDKHTLGTWQAGLDLPGVANNNPDPRLVWSDSLLVADCRISWISQEQAEANARLIAAAPDLLTACQGLLMCSLPHDISGQRFIDNARAAIARATGEGA